jgi:hypothetical protein
MRRDWWTPLVGVAFVVVVVIGFAVQGEPPDAEEPVREIVDFYLDNESSVMVGAVLEGFAGALLIFFGGVLRKALSEAEGDGGVLSVVAMAGAVVIAIGAAFDATISFALAETADDIEPASVHTLQALWNNDFIPFAMGNLVFTLAAGLAIVRHGALPKWLGWVAILLAVISLTPIGFFAFLATGIWILAVSIVLTLRFRGAGTAAA